MDFYLILLRIVHVFSGVFWVGGGVMLFGFLEPTAKATAPAGQKFMQYLMTRQRFTQFMAIVSLLTVVAGALLFWRDSAGLQLAWVLTPTGIGFSLGAIIGISVFFVGLLGVKPNGDRLSTLGAEIEAAGKPPTPAQVSELTRINEVLARLSKIDFYLLTLALLMMATARYW